MKRWQVILKKNILLPLSIGSDSIASPTPGKYFKSTVIIVNPAYCCYARF